MKHFISKVTFSHSNINVTNTVCKAVYTAMKVLYCSFIKAPLWKLPQKEYVLITALLSGVILVTFLILYLFSLPLSFPTTPGFFETTSVSPNVSAVQNLSLATPTHRKLISEQSQLLSFLFFTLHPVFSSFSVVLWVSLPLCA